MISNPRKRRKRAIIAVIVFLAVLVGFFAFFFPGPTGVFSILTQRRRVAKLERDVREMKNDEVMFRSDIHDYQDTARVRKIATQKLGMVPKAPAPEAQATPAAPAKVDSSPKSATGGKR